VKGRFHPKRGRVLHFVGHSAPHSQVGYTVRTHSLARAQLEAGLEPHVVTRLGFPWDDGVEGAEMLDELNGVRYHRLRASGPTPGLLGARLAETVRQAAELVRHVRPAVLHAASDYRNALVALSVGGAFGVPVVYEVRGFWEETRLAVQGPGAAHRECYLWHRERELECMRRADRVVTLAETMRGHLMEWGVPADAIDVISNAVDTEKFTPATRDPALALELGIASDETVLGYVSSFSTYEGIRYLIDAVARLAAAGERVRCLLVGDGEERRALEAHAADLGVSHLMLFTGRVPHDVVLRYYGLIDVFVVPRTADRVSQLVTPLKPYEAMAAARTVVVSRVPALVEMIDDGVTALSFVPEDADDLARVVQGLIADPARREAIATAGRAWVCRERTWRDNGRRYLDLYRSLGAA
jgi:glycosyltransferase involved in cell wall biosynthesis